MREPKRQSQANVIHSMRQILGIAGLLVCTGIMNTTGIRAQSRSPQSAPGRFPKFEVVSIKPCKPGVTNGGGPGAPPGAGSSPGRLRISCGILADIDNTGMIQVAYNRYAGGYLSSFRMIPIEGGPDWMRSERFDIDATSDGQPSILMMQGPMMQAVLEDRFQLKIHRETRQGPVYELALGKGSPKLKPLQEGSCIPVAIGRPLPELTADQRRCTNMANPRGVNFEGGTLAMFAGLLGMKVTPTTPATRVQLAMCSRERFGRTLHFELADDPLSPVIESRHTKDALLNLKQQRALLRAP